MVNFSEDFFQIIINSVAEDELFPDVFNSLNSEEHLKVFAKLGKSIKLFLGPPQLMTCREMERGISFPAVEKLWNFYLHGGLAGLIMEDCPVGSGVKLADGIEFIGGLGVYGIFNGESRIFTRLGVTGYIYACLEGFLGFEGKCPYKIDINGIKHQSFGENGPYGIGLGSNIGAILSGYGYSKEIKESFSKFPGIIPGFFGKYGIFSL